MKQFISKTIGFLLVLAILFTSIPVTPVQAASKPVISSSQVKIKKNACSVTNGKKIKLAAQYNKKDITKTGTWKSSKKNVATISKSGVLTAKKAGTTYITVKYKGKTSSKLKVVVKANASSSSNSASGKGLTITYNKNSKNASDKLKGSATQKITTASGEILKFSTTVTPAKGKKFLGWYDAPTGGNRIYETYKPTGNITLYAHYTDENVQKVEFVLNCNYGNTYSFMSGRSGVTNHFRDFDWLKREDSSGPMEYSDSNNVKWSHNYIVDGKDTFAVDDMPIPSVPGYTFVGWYTADLKRTANIGEVLVIQDAEKIEKNSVVDRDITRLYARFTKKLTISFDDLRGGKYDDIVVDTYSSIEDCGKKLPTPIIPGATFLGWTMDPSNHDYSWSKPMVTNNSVFSNCIEWFGFMCSDCNAITKYMPDFGLYHTSDCAGSGAVNDDYHVFEETDHFTLYPVYKYQRVDLSFDPKGGYFPYDARENHSLTFDDGNDEWDYDHTSVGVLANCKGSQPYGGNIPYPGHEDDPNIAITNWKYGNLVSAIPVVERENYVFDKWVYLDDAGNEQEFTYKTVLSKNMTIYAKWKPGTCMVVFDATEGVLTEAEKNRVELKPGDYYRVTTESTITKDGKLLPVPVSEEGRAFLGWFTEDGKPFTADTQILDKVYAKAHWGTKTGSNSETQKTSTDKDTSANKDTDNNNKID